MLGYGFYDQIRRALTTLVIDFVFIANHKKIGLHHSIGRPVFAIINGEENIDRGNENKARVNSEKISEFNVQISRHHLVIWCRCWGHPKYLTPDELNHLLKPPGQVVIDRIFSLWLFQQMQ